MSERGDGDATRPYNRAGNRDNHFRSQGQGRDRRNYDQYRGGQGGGWRGPPQNKNFQGSSGRRPYVDSNASPGNHHFGSPRQPSGAIGGFGPRANELNLTPGNRGGFRQREEEVVEKPEEEKPEEEKPVEKAIEKPIKEERVVEKPVAESLSEESFESAIQEQSLLESTAKDQSRTESVEEESPHSDEFRQKLINAFNDNLDGTFFFKVGSEKVKVSKLFFAVQSKVFADLMHSDGEESKTNELSVDHLHLEAVQQFVEFIHLGNTEHLDRYAKDVLSLAEKFDVKDLKAICTQHLESRPLTDDTILESLISAFERQDEEKKKAALEFMAQSNDGKYFISIMLSDEWFKFQVKDPQLAHEITKAALAK